MSHEEALRIVYEAVDIVNQQLPAARRLAKSPDTVIAGAGGSLDSLGIINFVVTLEEKVGDAIGTSIQLLEPEMLTEGSPFRTIGALTHYIATRPV
jgi:hypothetical protein